MAEPTTDPAKPEPPKPYEDENEETAYQGFSKFMKRFMDENKPEPVAEPPAKTTRPSFFLDGILGYGKAQS